MRRREERSPLGADEGAAAATTTTKTTKRPRVWMASACKAAASSSSCSSCCCSCSSRRRRAALAVLMALLVASLVLHPVARRGSAWLVAAATGRPLPWQHSVVMITCPTEAVARDMARSLVERRLAACVSIIPKITSFFRWEGHVEEQGEFLLTRFPGLRVRHLFLVWLGVLVGSWVLYMQYSSYTELCRGAVCKIMVCDQYKKGIIAGSACSALCEEKTLQFQRCLSTHPTRQVYTGRWGKADVVIKCGLEEAFRLDLEPDSSPRRELVLFDKPIKGTSMDEFKEMLLHFLQTKLGNQPSLPELVSHLIALADVNRDGKVSLAEAKSAWALLQRNDFLLMAVLREREHAPRLLGFCGDTYVTERVGVTRLYGVAPPWPLASVVPAWLSRAAERALLAPPWALRAKVSIGLLEFTEEVFHGAYGSFHVCEAGPAAFGHNERHDARLLDLGAVVPEAALREALAARRCDSDGDCVVGSDCRAACDRLARRCSPDAIQPNLPKVCALLAEYLLAGCPAHVAAELRRQLAVCTSLRGSANTMEVHHSLVLNNLKALLWKQISNAKEA
ncbi:divergent protein kinase domain 1B-like isoform X2 [Lethenteron reissneri]|uniref:divergent protein kinase domain 1B-like isoform X2 n=1 Tax=Lethenteron reissneri TaxID=7753 RepID=UPI002AB7214F|nr:divergent protein kinase domain 1B-like isoform X2 [Lethenteron reissneri]